MRKCPTCTPLDPPLGKKFTYFLIYTSNINIRYIHGAAGRSRFPTSGKNNKSGAKRGARADLEPRSMPCQRMTFQKNIQSGQTHRVDKTVLLQRTVGWVARSINQSPEKQHFNYSLRHLICLALTIIEADITSFKGD